LSSSGDLEALAVGLDDEGVMRARRLPDRLGIDTTTCASGLLVITSCAVQHVAVTFLSARSFMSDIEPRPIRSWRGCDMLTEISLENSFCAVAAGAADLVDAEVECAP